MAVAAPRDTVEIAPGEYAEAVVLRDGVNLEARETGTVTLVAPPATPGWVALRAEGRLGQQISGIRILGEPSRPIGVGVRLSGHDLRVTDISIEGAVDVGLEVVNDGAISVRTSRLDSITGTPVRVAEAAHPLFERNVFLRHTPGRTPALEVTADASPELKDNVFVGYSEILKADAAQREQLLRNNLIVGPAPATATGRSRPGRDTPRRALQ
jgi:hypothetical protein